MKKLKATIPESLNEITLGAYQEFMKLDQPSDADFLTVLLGLPRGVVDRMPLIEVQKLAVVVHGYFDEDPKFQPMFTMSGKAYGFIPNLEKITFGEHMDIMRYLPKDPSDWADVHKAMAVMFRQISATRKGNYIIEKYKGTNETAEAMKAMPLGVALGAIVFFFDLLIDLLTATLNSTEVQREIQTLSIKSGEPTTRYIQLLRETLQSLTTLRSAPFTSALPT